MGDYKSGTVMEVLLLLPTWLLLLQACKAGYSQGFLGEGETCCLVHQSQQQTRVHNRSLQAQKFHGTHLGWRLQMGQSDSPGICWKLLGLQGLLCTSLSGHNVLCCWLGGKPREIKEI